MKCTVALTWYTYTGRYPSVLIGLAHWQKFSICYGVQLFFGARMSTFLFSSNIINLLLLLQAVSSTITSERLLTAVRYGGLQVVLLAMVSVSRHDGEKKHRGLTGGVVMITDVCSTIAWELPANLKPSSVLKSNSPSLFSEVSYPHPRREFKLPKREKVYNFDVMMFKRRYLKIK